MKLRLLIAAAALAAPQTSLALCVACTCSVSVPALTFGAYRPMQSDHVDISRTVTLSCSGPAGVLMGYEIAVSAGQGSAFVPRRMANGPHRLDYNVFADALRATVWGDGSGGSTAVAGAIPLLALGTQSATHTMYGRIFAGQNVVPGSYTDILAVTVAY